MTTASQLDKDAIAEANLANDQIGEYGIQGAPAHGHMDVRKSKELPGHDIMSTSDDEYTWPGKPTEEEMHTLRRVAGKIPWNMWTVAFVELCERFSYYGSSILYTNFVNYGLPKGSTTGSDPRPDGQPGALGQGTQAAQGISLFNQFFAYVMPLVGGWIADARMGRFWTLHVAIAISTVAHVVLIASAAPSVLQHKDSAFGAFIIGLLCLCVGTGFFKANVAPLLAEQVEDNKHHVETLKTGERVIVDPAVTNTRVFLYFYLCINIGSLTGQIGMVYVERYVGFWAAYTIPTGLFLLAPLVLWSQKKKYRLLPPTGSLLAKFLQMYTYLIKQSGWFRHLKWDLVKPSHIPEHERPSWMTYDDAWVDEVRRGLGACKVFAFLPIFFLAYNQMTGNLTTQASTMELHGVPNDIIQNLNPISIVILIPIIDRGLYPGLRKLGFVFTPIKRMTFGFFMSCSSMIAAAVMQYYIYKMGPCGWYPNGKDENGDQCGPAPINVWAQSLPYILVGISEIFTNVTSYEYAYSKAPENMRSLVLSVNLFMSAVSSAIGEAFIPLSKDPLFVWNYTVVAVIAFVGGIVFWFLFKDLDRDEDKLNMLKASEFIGQNQPNRGHTKADMGEEV